MRRSIDMELKTFYLCNIKEDEYHHRFKRAVEDSGKIYNIFSGYEEHYDYSFEIFDDEEAITKFRELCQPEVNFSGNENKCWFYLITYYLHKAGYTITEFPRLLSRPPVDPSEFTYTEVRNRIISQGGDDNGTVRYATRRAFIANLTFDRKANHIGIDDSLNRKFVEISTRQATFTNMSTDEKLAEIANVIEHLLKKPNGKFITLDYSNLCFGYVTNEMVTDYRKKMHCFRHGTVDALSERKSYSADQKNFFVNYGLTILMVIQSLLKSSD